jgi:hypothetical protein
MRLTKSK